MKVGRPLERMIIIDNVEENFKLQPENGIFIKSWTGDTEDTVLADITPVLVHIARKKLEDLREGLNKYNKTMLRDLASGAEDPQSLIRMLSYIPQDN